MCPRTRHSTLEEFILEYNMYTLLLKRQRVIPPVRYAVIVIYTVIDIHFSLHLRIVSTL